MKHEHHTSEHRVACIAGARALAKAADMLLEASQYDWTTVARPTIEGTTAEMLRAQAFIKLALEKVEKKEVGVVEAPQQPRSIPGVWPVSS